MFLDAYTIRKAVPRILIAVIGINLSIYLCIAAIDVFNLVGNGLGNLITAPFLNNDAWREIGVESNTSNNIVGITFLLSLFAGGAALIFAPAVIGAMALFALPAIAAFIISASLIILAVLFTLVIRQAIIIFCVIISPVAIALFVLPGTEKYFKSWWGLFSKALLVYPIVTVIFAISTVMTTVILGTADLSPGAIGLVKILSAVVVAFAPLVMIPFSFKLAGGALSTIMNAGAGKGRTLANSARQGLTKMREDPNNFYGKAMNKNRDTRLERGQTAGQVFSGLSAAARGRSYRAASGAVRTEKSMQRSKQIAETHAMEPIANNDDYLTAAMSFRDGNGNIRTRTDDEIRQYLTTGGRNYDDASVNQALGSIRRAQSIGSQQELDRFGAVKLASTGTGYAGGAHEMNEAILIASGARYNQANGTWEGGDRTLEGNLMAGARSAAQQARRGDLVSGFGTNMGALNNQRNGADANTINTAVTDGFLESNSGGMVLSQRGNSVENMVPAINRRINRAMQAVQDAHASGNQHNIAFAERTLKQELASTSALHDVATQVSPENARILADGVLGRDLSSMPDAVRNILGPSDENGSLTLLNAIDNNRSDGEFQQMHKEYQNRTNAEYANAQATAAAEAVRGQQPDGPGGIPGIPNGL